MGRGALTASAGGGLVATVMAAAVGAGPSRAAEVPVSIAPARIYVRAIGTAFPTEAHTFSFYVQLNACPALLEFDHADVIERPKTRSHRGVAIVTAYLRDPPHAESQAPCPPEARIAKLVRVKTKRPAASLIFLDGSSSPPRRIWPRIGSPPAFAEVPGSCGPPGAKTVLAEPKARIYALGEANPQEPQRPERLYGCLISNGESIELSPLSGTSSGRAITMYSPFALDAPWAAGAAMRSDGRDSFRHAVTARNLRSGRFKSCFVGSGHSPGAAGRVARVVLKHNGSLAWSGRARLGEVSGKELPIPEVVVCDSTGENVVDSDPRIRLHSLELHGSRLTWTDDGETRSAVLR